MKYSHIMKFWKFPVITIFWLNYAYSQPVVKVWGTKNHESIGHKLQILLDYLNVHEDILVSVNFHPKMPYHLQGLTTSFVTTYPDRKQVFQVLVDRHASKVKQWLILAHEMIHVKQFVKNELLIHDHRTVKWEGKMYFDCSYGDQRLPWEKEARDYDQTLIKFLK